MDFFELYNNIDLHSSVAKLYETCVTIDKIDPYTCSKHFIFNVCCKYGYYGLFRKIYSKFIINIHNDQDLPFRLSCKYDHINIAKWLYKKHVSVIALIGAILETSVTGNKNVLSWLYNSLKNIKSKHTLIENCLSIPVNKTSVIVLYKLFNYKQLTDSTLSKLYWHYCFGGNFKIAKFFYNKCKEIYYYTLDDKPNKNFNIQSLSNIHHLNVNVRINIYIGITTCAKIFNKCTKKSKTIKMKNQIILNYNAIKKIKKTKICCNNI